jgi:hypothetical protein
LKRNKTKWKGHISLQEEGETRGKCGRERSSSKLEGRAGQALPLREEGHKPQDMKTAKK